MRSIYGPVLHACFMFWMRVPQTLLLPSTHRSSYPFPLLPLPLNLPSASKTTRGLLVTTLYAFTTSSYQHNRRLDRQSTYLDTGHLALFYSSQTCLSVHTLDKLINSRRDRSGASQVCTWICSPLGAYYQVDLALSSRRRTISRKGVSLVI